MARSEPSPADTRRAVDRLRALAPDQARRAEFARELLATTRTGEVLALAAAALEAFPLPSARADLATAYAEIDSAGAKRDPGGMVRAALLRALRSVATGDEVALFARAAHTYEPTPLDPGAPAVLRAAAIVGLSDLDQAVAAAHAARMLGESETARTSTMNGEPAVTAARVLAYTGNAVALYLRLVSHPPALGEIRAECVRGLAGLPGDVLAEAVAEELAHELDEGVLVGYFDLIIAVRDAGPFLPALRKFLADTNRAEVFGYFAAAIVASRRDNLLEMLTSIADDEFNREKLTRLDDALTLASQTDAVRAAIAVARERLG